MTATTPHVASGVTRDVIEDDHLRSATDPQSGTDATYELAPLPISETPRRKAEELQGQSNDGPEAGSRVLTHEYVMSLPAGKAKSSQHLKISDYSSFPDVAADVQGDRGAEL